MVRCNSLDMHIKPKSSNTSVGIFGGGSLAWAVAVPQHFVLIPLRMMIIYHEPVQQFLMVQK
jgi:hypothetical protein